MTEHVGVLMAMLSSALGGTGPALVRFMIGSTDPMTLAALRFGAGFVILLPAAILSRNSWPKGYDWLGVLSLGVLFFGIGFSLFNLGLSFTTAARGALSISTLPLLTLAIGAMFGIERLTLRKSIGVFIAIGGTAVALMTGLANAPTNAWQGDLITLAAALCMAFYSIWSRPFIKRSGPLTYVTATMGAGAACVAIVASVNDGFAVVGTYDLAQWLAVLGMGAISSALCFFLWVLALEKTTPTRVACTLPLNPITASILAAQILGEPVDVSLALGIASVLIGIWIASTESQPRRIEQVAKGLHIATDRNGAPEKP